MSDESIASLHTWLSEPMEREVDAAIERLRQAEDVCRVAVMPDVHLAKDVCVGTVMATRRLLYPGAVGGDIGCGMLAVPFDRDADLLKDAKRAAWMLQMMYASIPAMRWHRSAARQLPDHLRDMPLGSPALEAVKREEGRLQLGTLGGGNHFVELQSDDDERLRLMIHSGSRAMGQAIRGHYVALARKTGSLVALDADSETGQRYIADVAWARAYADENRRRMAGQVIAFMMSSACMQMKARRSPATTTTSRVRTTAGRCCGCIARARCPRMRVWRGFVLGRWEPSAFTSKAGVTPMRCDRARMEQGGR
jgi:tRNA-splicing ligase RtcB